MVENLQIRPATEEDLPALTAMTQAFNDHLDALDSQGPAPDGEAVAAASMARFRPMAFGPDPICTVMMAELDGEGVGFLTYYLGVFMDDVTPVLHVADFFVRQDHRRRGIGTALMREAHRIARERGASRLFWTVWEKNTEAQRFYASVGAAPEQGSILMEWRTK